MKRRIEDPSLPSFTDYIKGENNIVILNEHAHERHRYFSLHVLRHLLNVYRLFFLAHSKDEGCVMHKDVKSVVLSMLLSMELFERFPQGFYSPLFHMMVTFDDGFVRNRSYAAFALVKGVLYWNFESAWSPLDQKIRCFNDFGYKHDQFLTFPYILDMSFGHKYCILSTVEGLFSFGKNDCGQCGRGCFSTEFTFDTYRMIMNTTNPVIRISTGMSHTMVLTVDGTLYGCGKNLCGQLGLGHFNDKHTLEKVIQGNVKHRSSGTCKYVISVSCGDKFTLILDNTGALFSCGEAEFGVLGLGGKSDGIYCGCKKPTRVNAFRRIWFDDQRMLLPPILAIHSNAIHSIVVSRRRLNEYYAFGNHYTRALGLDYEQVRQNEDKNQKRPIQLSSKLQNLRYIACGDEYSVFLNEKNELFGCGNQENYSPFYYPYPMIDEFGKELSDSEEEEELEWGRIYLTKLNNKFKDEEIVYVYTSDYAVIIHTVKRVIMLGKV